MRSLLWLQSIRLLALVALGTSVALTIDYLSMVPAFCGGASGCGALRESGLGSLVWGGRLVPVLPLAGVLAFGALFQATLLGETARRQRWAGLLGATFLPVGIVLLGIQAWLGVFCSLCVVVDSCALLIGVLSPAMARGGYRRAFDWEVEEPTRTLRRGAWQFLFALALLAPLLYPRVVRTSSLPDGVRALHVPGRINVVEFFDFGCPHCRALAPRLDALLAPHGERVKLIRRHFPLTGHPGAREAARLAICAEEQDREDQAIRAIWSAPRLDPTELLELVTEGADGQATQARVDRAALEACLASTRPDARLAADRELLLGADYVGLPTTYVGETRVLGAVADEVFRDALERAELGEDRSGSSPSSFWILVACVAGAAVGLGLGRRTARP
ncbi:MAG TPA: thioredoxin domain-containing protein [Polyangiaceae bacterium]|nr:thioredoxin domain-containing protein [Polyangiaceae bacterium]